MYRRRREGIDTIIFECEITDTGEKIECRDDYEWFFEREIVGYCEFCIEGIECCEMIMNAKLWIILNLLRELKKNQRKGIEMVIFFCEIDCEIMEEKSNVESYDRFLNE